MSLVFVLQNQPTLQKLSKNQVKLLSYHSFLGKFQYLYDNCQISYKYVATMQSALGYSSRVTYLSVEIWDNTTILGNSQLHRSTHVLHVRLTNPYLSIIYLLSTKRDNCRRFIFFLLEHYFHSWYISGQKKSRNKWENTPTKAWPSSALT